MKKSGNPNFVKKPTQEQLDLEALKRAAGLSIPFCPHEPYAVQRTFLALDDLEALFGGAGGGGKTDALLMAALKYVDVPGYSALLMRRTFADLALAGSIMDRAHEWLDGKPGVTWNERDHRFTFKCPGGGEAKLTFGYCDTDNDRFRYKSAEFQFIGLDELTSFTELVYVYLFSRLRRLRGVQIPLRMRGATNPGDQGHEWVKKRFVTSNNPNRPFIKSLPRDNPFLDLEAYLHSLAQLDESTRSQLELGLWITDSGQRIYKHTDENIIDHLPKELSKEGWHRAFVADLGASEYKPTTGFTQVAWHDNSPITFIEESWKESGIIPATLAEKFQERIDEYGGDLICIIDMGALGVGYGNELRQRYGIPIIAAEKKEKRSYRRLMNGALEKQETKVIGKHCQDLLTEWENLIYAKNGLDEAAGLANHCSDSALYGWRYSQAQHHQNAADAEAPYGTPAYWKEYSRLLEENEKKKIRDNNDDVNGWYTQ